MCKFTSGTRPRDARTLLRGVLAADGRGKLSHLNYLTTHLGRPPNTQPPPQQQPPAIKRLPTLPAPPNPSNNRATWPTGGRDAGEDGPGEGGAAGGFADLADDKLLTAAVEAAEE